MPPRKAAKDVAPVEETATGTYPAWSKPLSAVTAYWGVDLATGLSSSAVATRRAKYGFNELKKEAGKPLWKLILEQFDDPLVKVRLLYCLAAAPPGSCSAAATPVSCVHAAWLPRAVESQAVCAFPVLCPRLTRAPPTDPDRVCLCVTGDQLHGGV